MFPSILVLSTTYSVTRSTKKKVSLDVHDLVSAIKQDIDRHDDTKLFGRSVLLNLDDGSRLNVRVRMATRIY